MADSLNCNGIKRTITDNLGELSGREVDNGDSKPAAVLIPLLDDNGQWRVMFTKRTDKVDTHKGQISFPGGARDPEDGDMAATALRETCEEIGVARADVDLLASMEPTRTVTNYMVYPYVGIIPYPYGFELNGFEVDRLIEVPLEQLLDEADRQHPELLGELSLQFNRGGRDIIWGATARILYDFLKTAFPKGWQRVEPAN